MFPNRQPPSIAEKENHMHHNYYSLRRRSNHPVGGAGGDGNNGGLPSSAADGHSTTTPHSKVQNMYYPKIYSYKCYGHYKTTSNIDSQSSNVGGRCYGIAKEIETLYNEPIHMSRIEALQRFTSMNSDVPLDDYNNHQSHHNHDDDDHARDRHYNHNNNAGELSEQTVFLSPALIYKYENDAPAKTTNDNSNSNNNNNNNNNKNDCTADIDNTTKNEAQSTKDDMKAKNYNAVTGVQYYDDVTLEEELITEQDWTCYGVTDVEYLSLENARTGESKLIAVAPRNTGLSIRNIETDDHLRTLTRCSLGWIDILQDSNSVIGYDDDDDDDKNKNNSNEDKKTSVQSLADMMKKKDSDSTDNNDDPNRQTPNTGSIFTELNIPKDIETAMTIGQEHMNRTIDFTKSVATHMKYNVEWLYGNLRDDFPNRTVEAGKRCIVQIPKTVDGTMTEMNKIIQQVLRGRDNDDDHDDEDDHPSSGGRRF